MKSDPSAPVRLFLGQMPVHPKEVETNLARAEVEIAAAAARGGDVILLPEALDRSWRGRGPADDASAAPWSLDRTGKHWLQAPTARRPRHCWRWRFQGD